MKVLLVNGSPHKNGSTNRALEEVAKSIESEGIETEIYWIGKKPIPGCMACFKCAEIGKCVLNDSVNNFRDKASSVDGFVFGSPVQYAAIAGNFVAFLDRLFFSESRGNQNRALYLKPTAAVIVARRSGTTSAFNQLNQYFASPSMPIISSGHWNLAFGMNADEIEKDLEGMSTMRSLGKNMAWFLKLKEAGEKSGVELPEIEPPVFTNFIR